MKVAVETGGTLEADPGDELERPTLELLFEAIAETLVRVSEFEADVGLNFATREVEFFVVVEANGAREAVSKAEDVINQALEAAGVQSMMWSGESHTRPAVPA